MQAGRGSGSQGLWPRCYHKVMPQSDAAQSDAAQSDASVLPQSDAAK